MPGTVLDPRVGPQGAQKNKDPPPTPSCSLHSSGSRAGCRGQKVVTRSTFYCVLEPSKSWREASRGDGEGARGWGRWNPREPSGGSRDPEERFGEGQSPRISDQDVLWRSGQQRVGRGRDGMRKTEPEKVIPKIFARAARRTDQIKCSQTLKHYSAKHPREQAVGQRDGKLRNGRARMVSGR